MHMLSKIRKKKTKTKTKTKDKKGEEEEKRNANLIKPIPLFNSQRRFTIKAFTNIGLPFIGMEIIKTGQRLETCGYQNRRIKNFSFTTKAMLTAGTDGHC